MAFQEPIPSQTPLVAPDSWLVTLPWIQWLNSLLGYINTISGGTGAASYIEEQLVTANVAVTTAYATANDGDHLTVVLVLDGTGGWQITSWDATFKGVTVDDFDNRANYTNVYTFVWRGVGDWWLASYMAYNA